jgi:hypothetical protein
MQHKTRRGYGNDAPVEITKRFPQELGNLAGEREIPTFPQPIIFVSDEERRQKTNAAKLTTSSHTKNLTLLRNAAFYVVGTSS